MIEQYMSRQESKLSSLEWIFSLVCQTIVAWKTWFPSVIYCIRQFMCMSNSEAHDVDTMEEVSPLMLWLNCHSSQHVGLIDGIVSNSMFFSFVASRLVRRRADYSKNNQLPCLFSCLLCFSPFWKLRLSASLLQAGKTQTKLNLLTWTYFSVAGNLSAPENSSCVSRRRRSR